MRLPQFIAPILPTPGAPHLRAWWSSRRLSILLLLCLAPAVVEGIVRGNVAFLTNLGLSLGLVIGWQLLFARTRGGRIDADSLATALMFAVLLPPGAPVWQAAIGVSFGIVVGEQIFGGRGRNLLNPVVVGLSFLIFSFPAGGYDAPGFGSFVAALPGAVLLIYFGVISWRIVVGAVAGLALSVFALNGVNPLDQILMGGFLFGVIFLACDPVTSAATNPARWFYGLLIGFLVFLGRTGSDGTADGIVFAVLIASIFAPLADYVAITVHGWIRSRRYG